AVARSHLGVLGRRDPHVELTMERFRESPEVPVLRMRVLRRVAVERAFRELADPLLDRLGLALALEDLSAHSVDDLALLVHHVVVLEQVLADLEVVRLDALLRGGDRPRHQLVLDRLALLHAESLHDPLDALRAEDPEQVVLEREVEARGARIALAPRASPE